MSSTIVVSRLSTTVVAAANTQQCEHRRLTAPARKRNRDRVEESEPVHEQGERDPREEEAEGGCDRRELVPDTASFVGVVPSEQRARTFRP